jgi:uncharacterized membrane protein YiaA
MGKPERILIKGILVWLIIVWDIYLILGKFGYSIPGLIVGMILNYIWRKKGLDKYEKGLEDFEHYHWGLLLMGIGVYITKILFPFAFIYMIGVGLVGVGLALMIDESLLQTHRFAVGSNHEEASDEIGAISYLLNLIMTIAALNDWYGFQLRHLIINILP